MSTSDSTARRRYLFIAPVSVFLIIMLVLGYRSVKMFTADDYWFAGWGEMDDDPSICTVGRSFTGDWLTGARGSGGWLRPIPRVLFYFNDITFGFHNAWGYHLTNLLIHAFSASFIAGILLIVRDRESPLHEFHEMILPTVGGLLFAFYPRAPGAVSWVSGRTDLLATFFVILAVFAAMLSCRTIISATIVAVATVLACLSKESGFLAPLFVVFGLWMVRTPGRRFLTLFSVCAVASVGVFAWRAYWLGGIGGYGDQFDNGSATNVFAWIWQWFERGSPFLLLFLALAVLFWQFRSKHVGARVLLSGLAWWILAAIPVFLLPLTPVENDRYLYLAGLGYSVALSGTAILVVENFADHDARRKIAFFSVSVCAYLLIIYFMTLYRRQDLEWRVASFGAFTITYKLATEAPRYGPYVMAYEDMDPIRYLESNLQRLPDSGAKILPWDQASWSLYRFTETEHDGRWGFREEHIETGARFSLINADYSVTTFDASPALVGQPTLENNTISVDFAKLLPGAPNADDYYGVAFLAFETQQPFVPALGNGATIFHAPTTVFPGQPEVLHRIEPGLRALDGVWQFSLPDEATSATLHHGLIALFPLSRKVGP